MYSYMEIPLTTEEVNLMATSIFDDKGIIPNDDMVSMVLADKNALWDRLKNHVLESYHNTNQSWKYYSKKAGWSLVFKKKDRTFFYFIPCNEYFKISFVFGDNAAKTAEQSFLPEHIKVAISTAREYVEGKSFFVDVKEESDLKSVMTLMKIKDES